MRIWKFYSVYFYKKCLSEMFYNILSVWGEIRIFISCRESHKLERRESIYFAYVCKSIEDNIIHGICCSGQGKITESKSTFPKNALNVKLSFMFEMLNCWFILINIQTVSAVGSREFRQVSVWFFVMFTRILIRLINNWSRTNNGMWTLVWI